MKHTPGPWKYKVSWHSTADIGAMGEHLAEISVDLNTERLTANARLMAAAPDMLAALIEVEAMLDEFDANSERTMRVRAAIAKATGSQS